MKALFDTNILIDYLNGIPAAKKELALYTSHAISIVTWMEVLAGGAPEDEAITRKFLAVFDVIALDERIAARAVELRCKHRMKLPDAIILASAVVNSLNLVTRNTKDFDKTMPGIRVPYQVK